MNILLRIYCTPGTVLTQQFISGTLGMSYVLWKSDANKFYQNISFAIIGYLNTLGTFHLQDHLLF